MDDTPRREGKHGRAYWEYFHLNRPVGTNCKCASRDQKSQPRRQQRADKQRHHQHGKAQPDQLEAVDRARAAPGFIRDVGASDLGRPCIDADKISTEHHHAQQRRRQAAIADQAHKIPGEIQQDSHGTPPGKIAENGAKAEATMGTLGKDGLIKPASPPTGSIKAISG